MVTPADELIEEFEATLVADALPAQYNIAPTAEAPIVVSTSSGERRLGLARFGLIPHWAKSPREGVKMLNARAETVAKKPAYRDAFRRHRCLVAADGFYEWETIEKKKVPHRFHLDGRPFGFAGLWAVWRDAENEKISSFTILTCPAVGAVAAVHDRMPVILPRESYGAWLERTDEVDEAALMKLVEGHLGSYLIDSRVSPRVNSVKNDDASLIEPIA